MVRAELYPQAETLSLISVIDDAGPTRVALNRFKVVDLERSDASSYTTQHISLSLSLSLEQKKHATLHIPEIYLYSTVPQYATISSLLHGEANANQIQLNYS